jgi:hypothetical protein
MRSATGHAGYFNRKIPDRHRRERQRRRWNEGWSSSLSYGAKTGDDAMLTKNRLAIAAALLLGAASAAQAGSDNQCDPTRGFPYGPEGQRVGGNAVNPVDHLSTRPGGPYTPKALSSQASVKAEDILMSDGKCWLNTSNGNYGWANCPRSRH